MGLVTAGCIPIHLKGLHFRALFSLVQERLSEFGVGNVSVSFGLARLGWSGMFSVTMLCFEEVPAFDHLETQFDLLAFWSISRSLSYKQCYCETILEPGAPEPVGPLLSQGGMVAIPGVWVGRGEGPRM